MIAEAAYYRAQKRGFRGGDPLDDWLQAEKEINRLLPSPQRQKQELAAYHKLRELVQKLLAQARDTINADTIRQALEQARAQLRNLEEYTADTVDRVAANVERDMVHAAQRIGTRIEAFPEKTADLFQIWRDRGRDFLGYATAALGEWLRQVSGRNGTATYRSGEMTAAGSFACTACGETTVLATDAHLPPCPKCRQTAFHRL